MYPNYFFSNGKFCGYLECQKIRNPIEFTACHIRIILDICRKILFSKIASFDKILNRYQAHVINSDQRGSSSLTIWQVLTWQIDCRARGERTNFHKYQTSSIPSFSRRQLPTSCISLALIKYAERRHFCRHYMQRHLTKPAAVPGSRILDLSSTLTYDTWQVGSNLHLSIMNYWHISHRNVHFPDTC